jgi:hypothetical protein
MDPTVTVFRPYPTAEQRRCRPSRRLSHRRWPSGQTHGNPHARRYNTESSRLLTQVKESYRRCCSKECRSQWKAAPRRFGAPMSNSPDTDGPSDRGIAQPRSTHTPVAHLDPSTDTKWWRWQRTTAAVHSCFLSARSEQSTVGRLGFRGGCGASFIPRVSANPSPPIAMHPIEGSEMRGEVSRGIC